MKKKKMTLLFKPTFKVDVTDWYADERLTPQEREKRLREDFSDFSVFMQHAEYSALEGVDIQITNEPK